MRMNDEPPVPSELAHRLHEDVCQVLSAAALQAALIHRKLESEGSAHADEMAELRGKLSDAARSLRELMQPPP